MKLFTHMKRPATGRWNVWDSVVLVASSVGFALLSLGNMSRWSVWFDEAYGLFIIRGNYLDIARLTSMDVHPPMYYWALKAWTSVFGVGSEVAVRSLSLVWIMVAMVFIYLLVRRWFGQQSAALTLVLLALTPLLLRYSTEARMYGMTTAIVAAATYVLVSATEKSRLWKWLLYGLLMALGMWTHYFTALAFAAHWLWRWTMTPGKGRAHLKSFFAKPWLIAHGVALVAYAPWLSFAIKQLSGVQSGGFWIAPIGSATPLNFVSDTLMYRVNGEVTSWLAVLVWASIVAVAVLAWRLHQRLDHEQRARYRLIVIMALLPLLMLIVASLPPLRPAFVDRYVLSASIFLVVLIAITLTHTIGRWRRPARLPITALGLVLVMMVSGIMYVYQIGNFNKDGNDPLPIRPTLEEVWAHTRPGEPLLVSGMSRYYEVAFYEDRAPSGTEVFFEASDNLTWGSYDPVRPVTTPGKVYDTVSFAREHGGKFWYIADWTTPGKPALPHDGSWTVIGEVHAPSLPDGKSSIRAVELQLNDPSQ